MQERRRRRRPLTIATGRVEAPLRRDGRDASGNRVRRQGTRQGTISVVVGATAAVEDTYAYLLGPWTLERVIHDRRGGISGCFEGTAEVAPLGSSPGAATAACHEQGVITWGEHTGPAERRLVYVGQGDGSVEVLFGDGRRGFALALEHGRCDALHLCGTDRYEITVTAVSADELEERWRVRGPGKDYEALTVLRRSR